MTTIKMLMLVVGTACWLWWTKKSGNKFIFPHTPIPQWWGAIVPTLSYFIGLALLFLF